MLSRKEKKIKNLWLWAVLVSGSSDWEPKLRVYTIRRTLNYRNDFECFHTITWQYNKLWEYLSLCTHYFTNNRFILVFDLYVLDTVFSIKIRPYSTYQLHLATLFYLFHFLWSKCNILEYIAYSNRKSQKLQQT